MGIGDSYLQRQRKQNAIRGLINEGVAEYRQEITRKKYHLTDSRGLKDVENMVSELLVQVTRAKLEMPLGGFEAKAVIMIGEHATNRYPDPNFPEEIPSLKLKALIGYNMIKIGHSIHVDTPIKMHAILDQMRDDVEGMVGDRAQFDQSYFEFFIGQYREAADRFPANRKGKGLAANLQIVRGLKDYKLTPIKEKFEGYTGLHAEGLGRYNADNMDKRKLLIIGGNLLRNIGADWEGFSAYELMWVGAEYLKAIHVDLSDLSDHQCKHVFDHAHLVKGLLKQVSKGLPWKLQEAIRKTRDYNRVETAFPSLLQAFFQIRVNFRVIPQKIRKLFNSVFGKNKSNSRVSSEPNTAMQVGSVNKKVVVSEVLLPPEEPVHKSPIVSMRALVGQAKKIKECSSEAEGLHL